MQVVVDDLVAILKVEAFREHIRCHNRVEFRLSRCKLVFGIGFRCEPADHTCLALVPAEDHFKLTGVYVCLKILKQVSGCVRVLSKDEQLAPLQRFLPETLDKRL